jgi:hypothetical protein
MMLLLLTALALCGSLLEVKGDKSFTVGSCHVGFTLIKHWKANVTSSEPLQLLKVEGGEVTFIRDDGLYLEITGSDPNGKRTICINLYATFTGDTQPDVEVTINSVDASVPVRTREIRSMRVRRAQQIWHVASVPVTNDKTTLLRPFEPYHHQWGDGSMSGSTKHSSVGAVAIHYAKGTYSQSGGNKGGEWKSTPTSLGNNVDDLILKYDIFFDNFGFGKMGKLPGQFGGVQGEGAYGCGGGSNPSTCFSLRMMWRDGGAGELYAYIPTNQEPGFNNRPDVIHNDVYGQSIGRGKIHFQNNVWQTVTQQVHLNTVGKTDGWVKFCNQVHGSAEQCYTAHNILFRNANDHHLRGLYFSTFFGGSQPDDAAPNDCHTYYKEFSLTLPDDVVVG